LLFLGRLHKKKGLELCEKWAQLETAFPEWCLVIAGSDSGYHGSTGYLESLKGMVRELGLTRVSFVGALYGEEKWGAYRRASLFVLPTHSENFAMTVAESLALVPRRLFLGVRRGPGWPTIKLAGGSRSQSMDCSQPLSMECRCSNRSVMLWGGGGVSGCRDYSWEGVAERMMDVYRWLDSESGRAPDCVRID